MSYPTIHLCLDGLRVLIVGDNAINRQAIVELLQAAGVTVELAGDGGEAVHYLIDERRSYDAVLMDLQLPTMDGLQATRSIRADPRCTMLPIIAMTAHTVPEERDCCLAAGMNDYLAKPFGVTQVLQVLTRWTEKRVTPGSNSSAAESAPPPALPGLDLEAALQRLDGDRRLLSELLVCVAEEYGDAATTVRTALSRGDPVTARRLVHTLKGVAGNVGATALQDAAAAVEQVLREGALPEETPLLALEAALAQALESMALVSRTREPPLPLDFPTRPELQRGLHELLVRLERQALNAADLFQSLHQAMLEAQPGLPVEQLGRYIERLDFKTASQLLRELAPRIGIRLEGD